MIVESGFKVISEAGVEAVVGAKKNVYKPHINTALRLYLTSFAIAQSTSAL